MTYESKHLTAASILKQDSSVLHSLFERLKYLEKLVEILSGHLEPLLVRHSRVANFENGCLMIIAESAIWATRIRFQAPQLIPKLSAYPELYGLKSIECKVVPIVVQRALMASPYPPRKMPEMNKETAEIVLEMASGIKEDKLRKVMERIAKRFT